MSGKPAKPGAVRLACLWVPDFLLQALRRSLPELAEVPLVIAAGPLPRDPIVAVSAEAAEMGVPLGVTAAQVRSRAPAVLVRVTPPAVAAAAGEALADVAGSFSPRIRRSRPGEVVLDVGGLLPRFGSEEAVVHELLRGCHRIGLDARAGVASNLGVARVAARSGAGGVVRQGEERAFLAPLPLAALEPAPLIAAALTRWGIATAGELACLPRAEVALRLGPQGLALHRLAGGEEAEAFVPDPAQEALREGVVLEDPIGALEPFLFVLRGILSRLAARLELRGEGFAEVLLELALEGGERREARIRLVAPTREVPAVLALARLELEARPPGAPVEGVTVAVAPGTVRLVQGSLFGPAMPAPGKLAMTLARLAALVGSDRVASPAVSDTHRPGAWSVVPFTSAPREPSDCRTPDPGPRTPVLRAFRPPRDAEVVTAGARPVVARAGDLGGVVVASAGPYRFVGDWWADDPFARDDFDVATDDGSLLRVFFDHLTHRWLVDGIYD